MDGHGVVPLRETYAIGGEFLNYGQYEHGGVMKYHGRDRGGPLPDYDHRTHLLAVRVGVLGPA